MDTFDDYQPLMYTDTIPGSVFSQYVWSISLYHISLLMLIITGNANRPQAHILTPVYKVNDNSYSIAGKSTSCYYEADCQSEFCQYLSQNITHVLQNIRNQNCGITDPLVWVFFYISLGFSVLTVFLQIVRLFFVYYQPPGLYRPLVTSFCLSAVMVIVSATVFCINSGIFSLMTILPFSLSVACGAMSLMWSDDKLSVKKTDL